MESDQERQLIDLTQQLLNSIDQLDWDTYAKLCDPSLSAFEPEALGNLVEGMEFHNFYFKLNSDVLSKNSTMSSPKVRLMTDSAVVTYIRVVQVATEDSISSSASEETRVWQKIDDEWRNVHFHRSTPES